MFLRAGGPHLPLRFERVNVKNQRRCRTSRGFRDVGLSGASAKIPFLNCSHHLRIVRTVAVPTGRWGAAFVESRPCAQDTQGWCTRRYIWDWLLSPLRGSVVFRETYPRLASWAVICRRYAACLLGDPSKLRSGGNVIRSGDKYVTKIAVTIVTAFTPSTSDNQSAAKRRKNKAHGASRGLASKRSSKPRRGERKLGSHRRQSRHPCNLQYQGTPSLHRSRNPR
jgi:hypothetical protein